MQLHFNYFLSFCGFLTIFFGFFILSNMIKGNIGILDSGIGGLSVLSELDKTLNEYRLIYLGDNKNAPYGNKSVRQLYSLTIPNLILLKNYNIDVLVLGCNTLSVNLLTQISDYVNVKTFGVFPPVELFQIRKEKTLLLSTISTSKKFQGIENVFSFGLVNLAKDIEDNAFNLNSLNLSPHFALLNDRKTTFDNVILGCTHYNLIKNKIFDHLKPKKVLSGVEFTKKIILGYLKIDKSSLNKRGNEVLFIGENSLFNKKIYEKVVKTM